MCHTLNASTALGACLHHKARGVSVAFTWHATDKPSVPCSFNLLQCHPKLCRPCLLLSYLCRHADEHCEPGERVPRWCVGQAVTPRQRARAQQHAQADHGCQHSGHTN